MGLNFPAAPLVGDVYPTPAIVGVPQWTWNGTTWKTATGDASSFVRKAGDTMTGNLVVATASWPQVILDKAASGTGSVFEGRTATKARWQLALGDQIAEGGTQDGSDFTLARFNNAGTYIDIPFRIYRTTGNAVFSGQINSSGNIVANNDVYSGGGSAAVGTFRFGNNGTKYLTCDGTNYGFGPGGVIVNGNLAATSVRIAGAVHAWTFVVKTGADQNLGFLDGGGNVAQIGNINDAGTVWTPISSPSAWTFTNNITMNALLTVGSDLKVTNGVVRLNSAGDRFLYWDGTTYTFSGAPILVGGNIKSTTGFMCKAGTGGAYSNVFNYFWNNTAMEQWVDNVKTGTVSITSDYRTKTNVLDLPGTWDAVKALRPISYEYNDWSPPWHEPTTEEDAPVTPSMFVADGVEHWGFIAHELQDALIMDAATGYKDTQEEIQSPNPWTVIAALTKALQEAMTRIEALEAA